MRALVVGDVLQAMVSRHAMERSAVAAAGWLPAVQVGFSPGRNSMQAGIFAARFCAQRMTTDKKLLLVKPLLAVTDFRFPSPRSRTVLLSFTLPLWCTTLRICALKTAPMYQNCSTVSTAAKVSEVSSWATLPLLGVWS